jgi:hypothetical protein
VDRDGQGEHAGGVVGGDVVGVQGLAEEDLPGEGAVGPFGDDQLVWVVMSRLRDLFIILGIYLTRLD